MQHADSGRGGQVMVQAQIEHDAVTVTKTISNAPPERLPGGLGRDREPVEEPAGRTVRSTHLGSCSRLCMSAAPRSEGFHAFEQGFETGEAIIGSAIYRRDRTRVPTCNP